MAEIFLHTLQVPLELLDRSQSSSCLLMKGFVRFLTQSDRPLQMLRENNDNTVTEPSDKEDRYTAQLRRSLLGLTRLGDSSLCFLAGFGPISACGPFARFVECERVAVRI